MGPAEDKTAHQKFKKKKRRKENHPPEWKTDAAGTRKTSSTVSQQNPRTAEPWEMAAPMLRLPASAVTTNL